MENYNCDYTHYEICVIKKTNTDQINTNYLNTGEPSLVQGLE